MSDILKNLGLEENEVRVYEALLELGPSRVSEVSNQANISRTLGYHVLEKLSWHGLVDRVSGAGSRIKYSASHPRALAQYANNFKNLWERRLGSINEVLPDLINQYQTSSQSMFRFSEGVNGVKQIYNQTLESKKEILSILDVESWINSGLKEWGVEYNRERSRRKIYERVLLLDTPAGRDWMKHYKGSFTYTNYRWIKKVQLPGLFDLGGEINIFDDKVVMALLKKPNLAGVLITSVALSNILRTLYELAWQVGGPARNATHSVAGGPAKKGK